MSPRNAPNSPLANLYKQPNASFGLTTDRQVQFQRRNGTLLMRSREVELLLSDIDNTPIEANNVQAQNAGHFTVG